MLMDYRQSRPWMELILPLYTLALVILYYRPQALPPAIEEKLLDGMFRWVIWGSVGALGGVLALSALFLTFYLLYSPFYLVENAKRILDPHAWVDQREVRFYLGCFVLLVSLVVLAIMNPDAALVSFLLLAGSAQFLWRFLV
jgi:multisubunit Na+/H+ antiporter MnhB subunit